MKAAHIRKVRWRIKRAQDMLFTDTESRDPDAWVSHMAGILDVVNEDRGQPLSRKERQAEADSIWRLLFSDIPGVCDALIEANQEVVRQRRQISALHAALRRNGVDFGDLGKGGAKNDEPANDE